MIKSLQKKASHSLVFAHGDIQEHNIIASNSRLEIIDFEVVSLADPASEIAYTLTQFSSKKEFNKKKERFS